VLCGDDYPDIEGQELLWEIGVHREKQLVAEIPVFRPFGVAKKVDGAGFDFDTHELAIRAKGQNVRAPAVWQGELMQRRPGQMAAQAGGLAAYAGGAFGE